MKAKLKDWSSFPLLSTLEAGRMKVPDPSGHFTFLAVGSRMELGIPPPFLHSQISA